MSLVAYGSSGESSDEEEVMSALNGAQTTVTNATVKSDKNDVTETQISQSSKIHMNLPTPKYEESPLKFDEGRSKHSEEINKGSIQFGALPKPMSARCDYGDIEEDDDVPLFKPKYVNVEKPVKPDRVPVRISVPSLSDFKDVDEELAKSKTHRTASKKGTGLFSLLPPPKSETQSKKNNFIPHVLTKTPTNSVPKKPIDLTKTVANILEKPIGTKLDARETKNPLSVMNYDSNSEDDDDDGDKQDFFALTKSKPEPEHQIPLETNFFSIPEKLESKNVVINETIVENISNDGINAKFALETDETHDSGMTLISTVMNLPREEILLKNKAEVGPKLPVPEQEFNIDSEGNVAFDDKAIEYLCGKRGIKRKNLMIDETNIIEINGEDIKPDEREWMVKALTEEPVQRPVSMQSAGPSSQSKKKHQITYLAHQAKAMEVELKNSWSQNRMARKQTQSKYGF